MGFGLPVLLWVLALFIVLVGGILSPDLDGVIFSSLLALALSVLALVAGGYFFTLLGLVWIAAHYRQPELIIKGSIAYAVIWATTKIALHMML